MTESNSRSSLLLIVSLLLFLMSFVILCTWGYNAYYKEKDAKNGKATLIKDTAAIGKATREIANATRDSLQKVYAATIQNLDRRFDSTLNYADTLKGSLNVKLAEFYKLKQEISDILKDRSNNADLGLAKRKIAELQKRIDELLGKNNEVEQENKRLYAMIKQLSSERAGVADQGVRPVLFDGKPVPDKSTAPENIFQAYDLRLSAIMVTDDKELETYQAMQTDKFVGSFIVKNNNAINNVAEMVVVVVQPDGKVIQKSTWESGTFESTDGKKIYSCKMRFDYTRGEPKKLLFSLSADKFLKGNYTMQVYYNGMLIGKIYKTLT